MTGQQSGRVSDLPTKEGLYKPILAAFRALGGSASPSEIEARVIADLGLPDDVMEELTPGGWPRLRARLDWARLDLKYAGYLESEARGVWALSPPGQEEQQVDQREILRRANQAIAERKLNRQAQQETRDDQQTDGLVDEDPTWRDGLLQLLQSIEPSQFERLCQRVLRSSGFTEVNVSGKSGDGGIDGNGILQIQGIISVPVAFQCKRYRGSVGSPVVREFRGSLGRQAERGLLMTTGTFTQDARREATREGAVFIDLMDGDALLDKLKELQLGVKVEMVEQTTVDLNWWESNYGVSLQNGRDEGDE